MNIAIWGLGVSGLSALKFLKTLDHNIYAINQGSPKNWKQIDEVKNHISLDRCFDQSQIPSDLKLDRIILSQELTLEFLN